MHRTDVKSVALLWKGSLLNITWDNKHSLFFTALVNCCRNQLNCAIYITWGYVVKKLGRKICQDGTCKLYSKVKTDYSDSSYDVYIGKIIFCYALYFLKIGLFISFSLMYLLRIRITFSGCWNFYHRSNPTWPGGISKQRHFPN